MTPLTRVAHAKLNLALHVHSRRPDGYHALETVFVFAEEGDIVTVAPSDTLTLEVTGPFAAELGGPDNLVLRAAEALRGAGRQGARILLDKRLPVAAGLGGGSADAAAALLLLRALWSLPADDAGLAAIGRGLGADVPACLLSTACRGEGTGDALTPIAGGALAGMPVLLVNPGVPLSTGAVFAAWDGQDRGPLGQGDILQSAHAGRNDLEPPARALRPVIGDVLGRLAATPGQILTRMSGSGATCFALYEDDRCRDSAADAIRAAQPDWWVLATRLRP